MTEDSCPPGAAGEERLVSDESPHPRDVHEPPFGTVSEQPENAETHQCANCTEEIPVHRTRCLDCLSDPDRKSSSDGRPGQRARELALAAARNNPDPRASSSGLSDSTVEYEDTALETESAVVTRKRYFHRVVLAVVHAKSDHFALTNARAALDRRGGRWRSPHDRTEGSFKTIDDAEDLDAVAGGKWEPLPEVTMASSSIGVDLLERARELTLWDGDVDGEELLAKRKTVAVITEPYIYGPGGQPITSRGDLEALLNGDLQPAYEDGEDLWIVPALIFKFEYEGSGEYERELYCPRCDTTTQHVFLDHERSHPEIQDPVPVYMCSDCNLYRNGPEPGRSS